MNNYEASREELVNELKRDMENGKPLANPSYTARAGKVMGKDEFSAIRKKLGMTQAQFAELLDLSIKTIQAYEQGRIEVPGLVAKVLRLASDDGVFQAIFKGEITSAAYSKYVTLQQIIGFTDTRNNRIQFAESVIKMVNDMQKSETNTQIETMTRTPSFEINQG
jgi:DNA-binding transcriptional regulator YiaG